jgi:hypothetical protein
MRFVGDNALEYKNIAQEGTTNISRLIVAYTQYIQIQFDKVHNCRTEINRMCSKLITEKKSSTTEATGKAIVNITEKEDEAGVLEWHMLHCSNRPRVTFLVSAVGFNRDGFHYSGLSPAQPLYGRLRSTYGN